MSRVGKETMPRTAHDALPGEGWGQPSAGSPGDRLPAHMGRKPFGTVNPYKFCMSCGVRTDYANPTCLYPNRHNGEPQRGN